MFKQIRKQKGLEILEYGLIAALVIGGGAAVYVTLTDGTNTNVTKTADCIKAPTATSCKKPGAT